MNTLRDYLPDGWVVIETKEETVLVGNARILHMKNGEITLSDRRTGRTLYHHKIGDFTKFSTVGA